MPREPPLRVVRAGVDALPGLNPGIERFVVAAPRRDLPLQLINVRGAPHWRSWPAISG